MNGLEGFVIGMLVGIVVTYFFFITYAKLMSKADKEAAISKAKAKWGKK